MKKSAKKKPALKVREARVDRHNTGRPTRYTDDLAEEILNRVRGGESLKAISRDETMPSQPRLYDWAANHEDFSPLYLRARRAGLLNEADDLLAIADDGTNDWMDKETHKGTIRSHDHEHVTRSKLRIETRQWLLSRMIPETFGTKVDLSNKDGSFAETFAQAVRLANGISGRT